MNTSDSTPDDSHWSSLAHELGLDADPPRPAEPQATPVEVPHTDHHAEHLPDAADDDDTIMEPHLSGEPVAEESEDGGEESAEGEGGGKRRRRRRRRRRKGGGDAAGEAPAEGAAAAEDFGEEEAVEDEPHVEVPARDAMTDVIANWNVPSWDELIGGLYRPGN